MYALPCIALACYRACIVDLAKSDGSHWSKLVAKHSGGADQIQRSDWSRATVQSTPPMICECEPSQSRLQIEV